MRCANRLAMLQDQVVACEIRQRFGVGGLDGRALIGALAEEVHWDDWRKIDREGAIGVHGSDREDLRVAEKAQGWVDNGVATGPADDSAALDVTVVAVYGCRLIWNLCMADWDR